ncbi:MAG: DNA polymerase I [Spirochaetia bacterium]|nr:DNA polymerase I [Spirochaetia bacterium]
MKTLYILDGYSLIYKSYFAFLRNPILNAEGRNISAVFGFFRALFSIIDRYTPEYLLVALDSMTPTFRHEMYPEYKATRDKTPDDLHAQIPDIEALLAAMGIKTLRCNGYEADDIIATFAARCSEAQDHCVIITADKDLLQLVSDQVSIIRTNKDNYDKIDAEGVKEEWGVTPEQILDYLALCGDSADNIPGVKGIGPKNATQLLSQYKDIDEIYENIESIKGANRTKLENGRENCYLSRKLAELNREVPVGITTEDCDLKNSDFTAAIPLFQKTGVRSALKWLKKMPQKENDPLFSQSGQDAAPAAESTQQKRGTYKVITELHQLDELIDGIKKAGIYAFDSETSSIDVITNRPVGFSFCINAGEAYYIPVVCQGKTFIPEEIIRNKLRTVLEDPNLKLIGQNIKFDYQILTRWGINPAGIWFDTMIAAWLTDLKITIYNMDYLADHYFGYKTIKFDDVVAKGQSFQDIPLETATEYAAEDADVTFRLYQHLFPAVDNDKYRELFFNLEMPLVKILGDMELTGIRIDKTVLGKYSRELQDKLADIEKQIFSECGREFNINSTQQLQEVLFTDRKLKPVKKTKTGYSTDTSVLEALAAEDIVPEMILKYRMLTKLKSTYVDTLPVLTDISSRLHTTFLQTGTATGRLSSKNPNLQNIPIREEEGRRIRKAFIAKAGTKFLSADYSQIELVVLAHLSEDPEMTKAFKAGTDVHKLTASLIFDIPSEMVTPDQRRIAKVINFGVMYGMSAFRLSKDLGISMQQADAFIKSYFTRYAGIRAFMDRTLDHARENETVRTILGRERFIMSINSKNHNEKNSAERIAVNSPIQGSAADIVKLAMINISQKLKEMGLDSKMVLQIHDELIFEIPERELEIMKKLVKDEMENVMKLNVPLRVSIETADSWGDMH